MKLIISSSSVWSKTEKEVAEIIRDLYRVCLLTSLPFTWGSKRKRSAIQHHLSSSSSPTKRNRTSVNTSAVPPPPPVNGEASSPATPLSFPATESDDKPNNFKKKISLKKQKESSLKIIQDLTETKASLNQEIENVRHHFDKLKSFNLKLKIRKEELLCNSNGVKGGFKTPNLDIGKKVQLDEANGRGDSKSTAKNEDQKKKKKQPMQMQVFPNHHDYQKQNYGPFQSINFFRSGSSTHQTQVGSSSSNVLGRNINGPGPVALPDLNLPAEESFEPLDERTTNRANAAAQARQRRLHIFRLKKPLGNKQ